MKQNWPYFENCLNEMMSTRGFIIFFSLLLSMLKISTVRNKKNKKHMYFKLKSTLGGEEFVIIEKIVTEKS